MFFTTKASRVLDRNANMLEMGANLDERQRLILECIFNRKLMFRYFYILALGCFAELVLLISMMIYKFSDKFSFILVLLMLFSIITNFVAMLYYRSNYTRKMKVIIDYYGCFPSDLAKIMIKNIDRLLEGKLLPPEYYQADWKHRNDMYIANIKEVE